MKVCLLKQNSKKSKKLLLATHKPSSLLKHGYFNHVGKALDSYGAKYGYVIIKGDLDTKDSEEVPSDVLEELELSNLVHFPTIDLIIYTNKQKSFQNTTGISTGLSDFH